MKSLLNTEQVMRYLTHLSRRGTLLCFVARTQKQTPKEGAAFSTKELANSGQTHELNQKQDQVYTKINRQVRMT